MPSRIRPLEPEDATEADVRRRLAAAEDGWYGDTAFFGAMAHAPALFVGLYDVLDQFPRAQGVTAELLELMRLRIAFVHECAYCATVRALDVRDAVADREDAVLVEDIDPDPLTEHEYLAVRLADQFASNPHRITDEFVAELRSAFGDAAVIELLLFAALEVGFDRFCIALKLDTTEESPYPDALKYPFERE